MSDATPRLSPLHEVHAAAGATFTEFGGWNMPVRYTSDLDEHHAVRERAGIFDISHMAEIAVAGPDAAAYLDYALSGELSVIEVGQAKYTLLLAEHGGVIDDLIVYRMADDRYLVVANAGNHDPALAALTARAEGFAVDVSDLSDETALIAVQGPAALDVLLAVPGFSIVPGAAGAASSDFDTALRELRYYRILPAAYVGAAGALPVLIARTGYTGENGYEIFVPTGIAAELWAALVAAGAPHGLALAGLAARDTLRLEAGMPLYGHELSLDVQPQQVGLDRSLALNKPSPFVAAEALRGFDPSGHRVLVGLTAEGRRAARADYTLHAPAAGDELGRVVGVVTSGVLSPTLGHPVAMAMVDPEFAELGTKLVANIRGTGLDYTVTKLPFYSRTRG